MTYKRHKYNTKSDRSLNEHGSVVQCVRCGSIREYVASKPTYFLRDSVYHESPPCVANEDQDKRYVYKLEKVSPEMCEPKAK